MQLKLQRSQRFGGVLGKTPIFCLDVRADYSPEERHNIGRYRIGGEIIYSSQAAQRHFERMGAQLERTQQGSTGERMAGLARGAFSLALAKMSLNISIDSLGKGHHIECKDLAELIEAEETVRTACKNVTQYLDIAASFDGSETVIEYDRGEERVHIARGVAPLLARLQRPQAPAVAEVVSVAPVEAPSAWQAEHEYDLQLPHAELGNIGDLAQDGWQSFEQWTKRQFEARGWPYDRYLFLIALGGTGLVVLAALDRLL